jgi:hypothetical protein
MSAYRVPPRLAHVVPDDGPDAPVALYLMHLPEGPPQVLHDMGAWIWILAADGEADVPAAVAEHVDAAGHDVHTEVLAFLDDLVARGLLEPAT